MSFVNAVARGTSLNEIYPIGSVIIKNAPWNGFAGQAWVLFGSGKTLVGQDTNDADFSSLGQSGGSKTKQISLNEIPSHTHSYVDTTASEYYSHTHYSSGSSSSHDTHRVNQSSSTKTTGSTGSGQAFSILNPYQVVLYYRRTA